MAVSPATPPTTDTASDAPEATDSAAPKTRRGKARVAEILAVAQQLFVESGLAGMTMRQVAERIGMSLSNLQHYFPNPEALLRGVLQQVMNAYDPAYAGVTEGIRDPVRRLEAVLRYLIADVQQAATEKLFVEIWSLATRDAMVREAFDQMYCHHRRNLETFIAAANPGLSAAKVSLRAALIAMQIEGLMLLLSESKPQHPELAGLAEEAVAAALLLALAPEPLLGTLNGQRQP